MAPVIAGAMGAGGGGAEAAAGAAFPWGLAAILGGTALAPTIMDTLGMGSKNTWQTETKRLKELSDRGIAIPASFAGGLPQGKGRSTEELVAIENAKAQQGLYSNPTFAKSRNVADLKGEDIWGYSAFLDRFGNDWLQKFSEQQRRDIANAALQSNAVKEHHGTIDVDFGKIANLDSLVAGNLTNTPAAQGVPKAPTGAQPGTQQLPAAGTPQVNNVVAAMQAAAKQQASDMKSAQATAQKMAAASKAREIGQNLLSQNTQRVAAIKAPNPTTDPNSPMTGNFQQFFSKLTADPKNTEAMYQNTLNAFFTGRR